MATRWEPTSFSLTCFVQSFPGFFPNLSTSRPLNRRQGSDFSPNCTRDKQLVSLILLATGVSCFRAGCFSDLPGCQWQGFSPQSWRHSLRFFWHLLHAPLERQSSRDDQDPWRHLPTGRDHRSRRELRSHCDLSGSVFSIFDFRGCMLQRCLRYVRDTFLSVFLGVCCP